MIQGPRAGSTRMTAPQLKRPLGAEIEDVRLEVDVVGREDIEEDAECPLPVMLPRGIPRPTVPVVLVGTPVEIPRPNPRPLPLNPDIDCLASWASFCWRSRSACSSSSRCNWS